VLAPRLAVAQILTVLRQLPYSTLCVPQAVELEESLAISISRSLHCLAALANASKLETFCPTFVMRAPVRPKKLSKLCDRCNVAPIAYKEKENLAIPNIAIVGKNKVSY
jgi:hypothetical protein